jgi:DNA-directed RNA polymerase specialized sigma24 family protein
MPYPENSSPTDAELAIKLRDTGDASAFESLYKRHSPLLSAFLFRLAGDRAPSLLSKMAERLRDRSYAIRDVDNFHLWALGVVASFWREETKHDESPKESDPVAFQVIHRLAFYLRPVFILVHYFQMSIDEVASALRIPRGTATSRLQDAFASLVSQVAPAEPVPPPLPEVEESVVLIEELPSSEILLVAVEAKSMEVIQEEKPAEVPIPDEAPKAISIEAKPITGVLAASMGANEKVAQSTESKPLPPPVPPMFVSMLSPPPTTESGSSLAALIPKLSFPAIEPPKEPEKS